MPDETASFQRIEDQEIDKKAPWADDVLKREDAAKILGRVIRSVGRPHVIAINGAFGTGKTFFVKRLIQQFRNDDLAAVYFNAWEQDTQGEPLIAFIGELLNQLESKYEIKRQSKNMKALATAAGSFALRRLVPGALRAATAGVIGPDELKELGQAGKELIGGTGAAAEAMISSYSNSQDALQKFKSELEQGAKEVVEKTKGNAVYVFIDELDRCRPTFAVEFLEHIKHLFTVPGLVFVLSIDRDHLKSSISSIYGQGIDANGYLARFIDLNYKLPDADKVIYARSLFEHFNLSEVFSQRQNGESEQQDLKNSFSAFSKIFNLSLRAQDQAFSELNFILRSIPRDRSIFAPLLGSLTVIRSEDKAFFDAYCSGSTDRSDLEKLLNNFTNGDAWMSNADNHWGFAWLVLGQLQSLSGIESQRNSLNEKLENGSGNSNEEDVTELMLIEEILEIGQDLSMRYAVFRGYDKQTLGQYLAKYFDLAVDFDA